METKAIYAYIIAAIVILSGIGIGVYNYNEKVEAAHEAQVAQAEAQAAKAEADMKAAQLAEAQKTAEMQKRQAEEAAKAQADAQAIKDAEAAQKAKALEEQIAALEAEKASSPVVAPSMDKAYFEDSSDILEVGESISSVKDTITSLELKTLLSGTVSTSYGRTDYNQYLKFEGTSGKVVFGENDDDQVSDYLFFEGNQPVYEYELEFPSGLESRVDDGVLRDLDGRKVNILGKEYTFVNSRFDSGSQRVTIELLSGDEILTLKEGESMIVTVDGVEHQAEVTFVSDPNNGLPETKISIDGETTQALAEGETDVLDNGMEVGVSEILINSRGSIVKMFFGAHKVTISDKLTDDLYSSGADVDREHINYVKVQAKGSVDGDTVTISSIKYQVLADAKDGSDVFIAPGHGLSEYTRRSVGLLSDKFDIKYDGLSTVTTSDFNIKASGDDKLKLTFTNRKGMTYTVDYVTTKNGVFKYGTDDEELWFSEAANSSTYVIARNDLMVLTSGSEDKGYTSILRYEDIDTTDKILTFQDVGDKGGDVQVTYTGTEGVNAVGDLIVNGKTFKVYVGAGPDHKLSADLTGNGAVDSENAHIVINGGGVFSLGGGQPIIGNSFVADLTTLEKNFDTPNGDEVIEFTIEKVGTDEVSIEVDSGLDMFSVGDDEKGMSPYGTLVFVKDNSDGPDSVEIQYPVEQRKAIAYVTVG